MFSNPASAANGQKINTSFMFTLSKQLFSAHKEYKGTVIQYTSESKEYNCSTEHTLYIHHRDLSTLNTKLRFHSQNIPTLHTNIKEPQQKPLAKQKNITVVTFPKFIPLSMPFEEIDPNVIDDKKKDFEKDKT